MKDLIRENLALIIGSIGIISAFVLLYFEHRRGGK